MAAKVCYHCGKKLHGTSVSCTNCGAHQWREGTEKMGIEQLKEHADEEFRQGKLGNSEAHIQHMEKSMFLYSIIAGRIADMTPKLEDIEPMERCIRMLEYILIQERRAEFCGDERRQVRYRDQLERLNNMKDNLLYDRIEKKRTEKESAPAVEAPKGTMTSADKLDELVDYAIFTVSEMDEMGSWTFLGKPRSKNYMISMFSFLREIKGQIPSLEQKEREVLLHVMFQVADSYEKGTYPFPQDPTRAIDWHTEASERGLVLSQLAIGDIYLKGSGGMRPQLDKALEWYEKARAASTSPKINEYADAAIEHIKYTMRTNG
ncbi:MAG: hypothetical protein K2I93_06200 [Oscillospiraceae bacterium]|nr:hypothetical protein [Oscillospiraceae bacterium]